MQEIIQLETEAVKNGTVVDHGSTLIYDPGRVIGYYKGDPLTRLRIDISSVINKGRVVGGSYHGHPIEDWQYQKALKNLK